MYEVQRSWSTFSPDWGCQLGYRFDWSLTPKWTLGVGVAYSENHVEQTYHPYGYVDRIYVLMLFCLLPGHILFSKSFHWWGDTS